MADVRRWVGIEIALVHRPKYDDWSIPKGKLNSGEHPVVGAVREVWEETGSTGVPGRPLGEIRYLKDGAPKRVRFWAMRVASGEFVPNDEVDQMMWLPPREAQAHLHPEPRPGVVTGVDLASVSTWPCLLVRHGSAGERATWQGDDRERPLDALGDEQAEALVPLLSAYGIRRVLSADVMRCMETIGPYAERGPAHGRERAAAVGGWLRRAARSRARAAARDPVAAASHRWSAARARRCRPGDRGLRGARTPSRRRPHGPQGRPDRPAPAEALSHRAGRHRALRPAGLTTGPADSSKLGSSRIDSSAMPHSTPSRIGAPTSQVCQRPQRIHAHTDATPTRTSACSQNTRYGQAPGSLRPGSSATGTATGRPAGARPPCP